MQDIILVHYGEIILKGRNRSKFERKLVDNIRQKLTNQPVKVTRRTGRLVIELFDDWQQKPIAEQLRKTFGIENVAFGTTVERNVDAFAQEAIRILNEKDDWQTYAIRTSRVDKSFPVESMDINREVGAACGEAFPDKSVDLDDPDTQVNIEITPRTTYVTGDKQKGYGGLPVGVSGKVLCLISGGIDSPVAAWHMMKRGCDVDFVHFHSLPQTSQSSLAAVRELAEIISTWQNKATLFEVPFLDIQNAIVTETDPAYRIILYRRLMLQIAERIAEQNDIPVLVTGDAIAQVASQTLKNTAAISDAVDMPILRPLAGFNKQEVVDTAVEIGTYETSTVPVDDCCSLFMPKAPETNAEIARARLEHAKLDSEPLINQAIEQTNPHTIS
jgi:thiamine biosynthesis protein ThiI